MRSRVYADFNGSMESPRDSSRWIVPLDTWGSLRDLSNAGIKLHDGLKLVIHMDSDESEDIEADAVAYFDRERSWWYAELESEIRDVPVYDRSVTQFLCLGCRSDLGPLALVPDSATPKRYEHCPTCGQSFESAIAAPP
jgi:hypothetical protein